MPTTTDFEDTVLIDVGCDIIHTNPDIQKIRVDISEENLKKLKGLGKALLIYRGDGHLIEA